MGNVYLNAKEAIEEIHMAKDIVTGKDANHIPFGIVYRAVDDLTSAEFRIDLRNRSNKGDRKEYIKGFFVKRARKFISDNKLESLDTMEINWSTYIKKDWKRFSLRD